MDRVEVYKKATETWGENAQLLVAIEELSELTKAICKYMNRGGDVADIFEETADVEIMCEQIRAIFGEGADMSIDAVKEEKIARLAKKLGME